MCVSGTAGHSARDAGQFGFSAATNASAKNSAFTAGQPASVIVRMRVGLPAAGVACGAFGMP